MKPPRVTITLILLLTTALVTQAQSTEKKVEIGAHSTSLTVFAPDFFGDVTQPGVGGRVTYNFNRSIAAEGEINFFPQKNGFFLGEGRALQGQFGVKVGKRFEKFGVFAKVRPGFLSISDVFTIDPNSPFTGLSLPFRLRRKTHFTTDVGGVLELYPSARVLVRFDAGDTIIRFGSELDPLQLPQLVNTQTRVKNNFQFSAGVGFRLGDVDKNSGDVVDNDDQSDTPRYEVGMQFTSLTVDPPRAFCFPIFLCLPFDRPLETEPGLGGRFTFNLTRYLGFEAEGNWFTRDHPNLAGPGGHIFQGQFGVKAGKRLEKWGFFGKARPGFVGFTKTIQLVGTIPTTFAGIPTTQGDFIIGTKLYPSMDVGGVVEFYISQRVMTRMDLGDTVIWYGEYAVAGFPVSAPIIRRPPETKHNFQFSAGIGLRF